MTETPTSGAYEALIEEADYAALCAQPGSDLRGLLNRLSTALRFSEQERAEMARELEQAHADSRRMRKLEARMSRSITLANEIIALGKGSRDDTLAELTELRERLEQPALGTSGQSVSAPQRGPAPGGSPLAPRDHARIEARMQPAGKA